jgi:hypothetical protein
LHIDQGRNDVIGDPFLIFVFAVEHDIGGEPGSVSGPVLANRSDSARSELRYNAPESAREFRYGGTFSVSWMIGHRNLPVAELPRRGHRD